MPIIHRGYESSLLKHGMDKCFLLACKHACVRPFPGETLEQNKTRSFWHSMGMLRLLRLLLLLAPWLAPWLAPLATPPFPPTIACCLHVVTSSILSLYPHFFRVARHRSVLPTTFATSISRHLFENAALNVLNASLYCMVGYPGNQECFQWCTAKLCCRPCFLLFRNLFFFMAAQVSFLKRHASLDKAFLLYRVWFSSFMYNPCWHLFFNSYRLQLWTNFSLL